MSTQRAVTVTLRDAIAEQRREVSMTKTFYARRISEGKMGEQEAATHLARKMAVLEIVEELAKNLPFASLTRLRTIQAEIPDHRER